MTKLKLLTSEEVKNISYDDFNSIELRTLMTAGQTGENQTCSIGLSRTVLEWENILYREAERLCSTYTGGEWTTAMGFYELQGCDHELFNLDCCMGHSYQVNALEFSIVVNLFALSNLALSTYKHKPTVNRRAVFFSDYIKHLACKNADVLNMSAIYRVID